MSDKRLMTCSDILHLLPHDWQAKRLKKLKFQLSRLALNA